MSAVRKTLAERFWPKVAIVEGDGCWLWQASLHDQGYGQISVGTGDDKRPMLAHRAAWELENGAVPPGFWVLHRCDVRRCVRPSHLYLGTIIENGRDASERGRFPRRLILTDGQIAEVRRRRDNGEAVAALATAFSVGQRTIYGYLAAVA